MDTEITKAKVTALFMASRVALWPPLSHHQGPNTPCSFAQIIGFGSALLEDVDPNPANFVGAGIIHTRTTQIGCLLRLEPNLQAQVRRGAACTERLCCAIAPSVGCESWQMCALGNHTAPAHTTFPLPQQAPWRPHCQLRPPLWRLWALLPLPSGLTQPSC